MDSLFGKAENALEGVLSDQEKVDQAKAKAKEMLGQHMDQNQANEVVDEGEQLLEKFKKPQQ